MLQRSFVIICSNSLFIQFIIIYKVGDTRYHLRHHALIQLQTTGWHSPSVAQAMWPHWYRVVVKPRWQKKMVGVCCSHGRNTLKQSSCLAARIVLWILAIYYTCQLFLRYKREIFILGVLGFLKTTQSFPKIPEEVRNPPKTSEVCRMRSYQENAYPQGPTLVDNISTIVRSRGRFCHLFILHMVFVPFMGLS